MANTNADALQHSKYGMEPQSGLQLLRPAAGSSLVGRPPIKRYLSTDDKTPKSSQDSSAYKRYRPRLGEQFLPPRDVFAQDIALIRQGQDTMFSNLDGYFAKSSAEIAVVRETCDARERRFGEFREETKDRFEKNERQCDVVLRGIPFNRDTNEADLRLMIGKFADFIHIYVKHRDVVYARKFIFRNKSSFDGFLIIKFSDMAIRRQFMVAFFAAKVVTTQCLGFRTDNRIYLTDNLTQKNAAIRKLAIQYMKN